MDRYGAAGSAPRRKVAILGGGVGALATAFALTSAPDWQQRYESITVYQLGWRLGGKGASGRSSDPSSYGRIEEHGLHIWAGLYDNAFQMIRQCYAELGRAPDAPLGTWQAAFKPQTVMALTETYQGRFYPWIVKLPTNSQLPGEPDARLFLSLGSYLREAVELLRELFRRSPAAALHEPPDTAALEPPVRRVLEQAADNLGAGARNVGELLLFAAAGFAERLEPGPQGLDLNDFVQLFGPIERLVEQVLLTLLKLFMEWYWGHVQPTLDHLETRQHWIAVNYAYAHIRGVLEDNLIERGLDAVDNQDYRDWMRPFLMPDGELTINSPLAWMLYDADFSYRDGNLSTPDLSASVALYTMVRLAFTCKGAISWEMQAGMGDTVFTPLYRVLERRGVRFEFFRKVKRLRLSADGARIAAVDLGIQASVSAGDQQYQPLLSVKGLECWPNTPDYSQLEGGAALRDVHFEDWCSPDQGEKTLQAGVEFDDIVLGISLGALPYICCDVIAASPAWQAMVARVRTVRTQALQLWLRPTAHELGWNPKSFHTPWDDMRQPILGTFHATPLNTWADMSHLLEREAWPPQAGQYPLNIAYFCGPMPDTPPIVDGPWGPAQSCAELDQASAHNHVRATAHTLLRQLIGDLWPQAVERDAHGQQRDFRWELLVDNRPGGHAGPARLDSQYIRANVQPSERYVLSLSGSTPYRLHPGQSGFTNLYLAGDWTWNGFNAGCVEAAVMSALLASNAMCGWPARATIVGLDFGQAQS